MNRRCAVKIMVNINNNLNNDAESPRAQLNIVLNALPRPGPQRLNELSLLEKYDYNCINNASAAQHHLQRAPRLPRPGPQRLNELSL